MGCFILPRDERTIRAILKTKLPHVKLLKLKRHDTKFKLLPVPCALDDSDQSVHSLLTRGQGC